MKNIGILTYHRSINYGAFMQCYSLATRLQEDFPNDHVEVIDYLSEKVYLGYRPSLNNYLKLCKERTGLRAKGRTIKELVLYLLKKQKNTAHTSLASLFESSTERLPLSSEYIVTDSTEIMFNKIAGKYDILIVGSDAVWNWVLRGFPNPYFLNRPNLAPVKMSYSASSYGQEYLDLSDEKKRYIREAWRDFKYLGVRDIATEQFVSFIDPELKPTHNCDPTVFLDLSIFRNCVDRVKKEMQEQGVDFSKPIVGIMGLDDLGSHVRKVIGEETQLVAIFKKNTYADFYLGEMTPFEWSVAFSLFSVTFTHYFHGNLLSLKNGTPTIIIEHASEYNKRHNSKIRDLMGRLDLLNHCFYMEDYDFSEVKSLYQSILADNKNLLSKRIDAALKKEAETYLDFKLNLSEFISDKKSLMPDDNLSVSL